MRQILGRSAPLLIAALLVGGYAVAETSQVEHTFCVNKKSKAVTYGKDGKCPKGSDPIQVASQGPIGPAGPVGAVGPAGAKGDTPITSYNLVLRDGSGAPVRDLISDSIIFRDGHYWALNYYTGKFGPISGINVLYLDPNCNAGVVYPLFGIWTTARAQIELPLFKENIAAGVLYSLYSYDGSYIDSTPHTFSANAQLVDNRNYPEGEEIQNDNIKNKLYRSNGPGTACVEDKNSVAFYITGIERSTATVPSPLPTPIRWSKP